jgi:hypothetical protein
VIKTTHLLYQNTSELFLGYNGMKDTKQRKINKIKKEERQEGKNEDEERYSGQVRKRWSGLICSTSYLCLF